MVTHPYITSQLGREHQRQMLAARQRRLRRPNTAPAYYLGRPAALWITARTARHAERSWSYK